MNRNEPEKKTSDEVIIKQIDAWQFSISKSNKRLYIDTTHYHPLKLELSRDDVQELLDIMDKAIK